jgi:hypothetical protein
MMLRAYVSLISSANFVDVIKGRGRHHDRGHGEHIDQYRYLLRDLATEADIASTLLVSLLRTSQAKEQAGRLREILGA